MEPRYLGDGVYASFDGYHIWLVTGSHDKPDNRVALEPFVFEAAMKYGKEAFGIKESK